MRVVTVSAPSRLHFGLLRLAAPAGPSFGGLGMMIDRPRVEVELAAANEWSVEGFAPERALEAAQRALAATGATDKPPALALRVTAGAALHRGLGGGTQLALAIVAGIRELLGLPRGDAATLAAAVGRGERSAVGSHGFVHGGLIWELGRQPNDALSALAARVETPSAWRCVLIDSQQNGGLSGQLERAAFQTLPPVPAATTERLRSLAENEILPAARRADLEAFGQGVYQYGRLSGEQFTAVQGGAFASPQIVQRVAAIRALGVSGVGQSSWGPTVFAFAASQPEAEALVRDLKALPATADCAVETARPENNGARLSATSP